MRIGINALYLLPGCVGGTEIYLRELLAALALLDRGNQYVVFTNRETGRDLVPEAENFEWAPQAVRAKFRPGRILYEQLRLPREARRWRLDVLFNPGFTAPALLPCSAVTVFHDLQHLRHPEFFRWYDLPFWRLLLGLSARRASLLIADSENTRQDLLRFYDLRPDRVRTVSLAAGDEFFAIAARRWPAEPRTVLCVSTLHPHKNIEGLLLAFARFNQRHPGYRLVLVGMRGFAAASLERLVAELRLGDVVLMTGWIERQQLLALYETAWCFVYPSRFEGFGIPVVEALAAGVPTACSKIEPLASNAADAAVQFDPDNVEEICAALERVTGDVELRARLAVAGPRRAGDFRWSKTAAATLEVLRDACELRRRIR